MDHVEPLKRAIHLCGGQSELASKIGRSQQYVWFCLNLAKKLDPQVAIAIEEATQQKVKREELCPRAFAQRASA